jgi:hypothetical protein
VISTSCHNCRFAIKDEGGNQTDCRTKMLDQFKADGKVEQHVVDGAEAYKTVDRFCPLYRPTDWMKELSDEEAIAEARKERTLSVAAIVSCEHGELSDVAVTAELLAHQTLPVNEVVFTITPRSKVKPKDVLSTIRDLDPPYEYSLRYVMDKEYTETDALHEATGNNIKSVFIVFLEAGKELPNTYLADLDYTVNDLGQRIVLVDHGKLHGLIVQTNAYRMVGGFAEVVWEGTEDNVSSVAEKIKRIAKDQNSQHLILSELPHVS